MFEFNADSCEPHIKSGVATWTYDRSDLGLWVRDCLSIRFESFDDAFRLHTMIGHVYDRGEAEGHANLANKVLNVIK
jgi:hypothetical protein